MAEVAHSTLESDGAGSLLNLSQVTAITGNSALNINTSSGGAINLQNLASIGSGVGAYLGISGGTVNVLNVGGGTSNGGLSTAQLSDSGALLWGSPTALNNFGLTLTGTGNTVNLSQVVTGTNVSLYAVSGAKSCCPRSRKWRRSPTVRLSPTGRAAS